MTPLISSLSSTTSKRTSSVGNILAPEEVAVDKSQVARFWVCYPEDGLACASEVYWTLVWAGRHCYYQQMSQPSRSLGRQRSWTHYPTSSRLLELLSLSSSLGVEAAGNTSASVSSSSVVRLPSLCSPSLQLVDIQVRFVLDGAETTAAEIRVVSSTLLGGNRVRVPACAR